MLKKIVSFILFLNVYHCAVSENHYGVVYDGLTSSPLSGALVEILGPEELDCTGDFTSFISSMITGADGSYEYTAETTAWLISGYADCIDISIRVSKIGYQTQEQVYRNGNDGQHDFYLFP